MAAPHLLNPFSRNSDIKVYRPLPKAEKVALSLKKRLVRAGVRTSIIAILGLPVTMAVPASFPTSIPITPTILLPWMGATFYLAYDVLKQVKKNNRKIRLAKKEGNGEVKIKSHKFCASAALLAAQIICTACLTRGQIIPYQFDLDNSIKDHLKVLSNSAKTLDDIVQHPEQYKNGEIVLPLAYSASPIIARKAAFELNDGLDLRDPIVLELPIRPEDAKDAYVRISCAASKYQLSAANPELVTTARSLNIRTTKNADDAGYKRLAMAR